MNTEQREQWQDKPTKAWFEAARKAEAELESALARLRTVEQERDEVRAAYVADSEWVSRCVVAEARVEGLLEAIANERHWATGTAEHNDARTELYRLAALPPWDTQQ